MSNVTDDQTIIALLETQPGFGVADQRIKEHSNSGSVGRRGFKALSSGAVGLGFPLEVKVNGFEVKGYDKGHLAQNGSQWWGPRHRGGVVFERSMTGKLFLHC